jgi:hypothetical protein
MLLAGVQGGLDCQLTKQLTIDTGLQPAGMTRIDKRYIGNFQVPKLPRSTGRYRVQT